MVHATYTYYLEKDPPMSVSEKETNDSRVVPISDSRRDPVNPEPTNEGDKPIIDAYLSGEKTVDILERFNISRSSLYWVLGRNGISPSRQRRPASKTKPEPAPGPSSPEMTAWFQEIAESIHEEIVGVGEQVAQVQQKTRDCDQGLRHVIGLVGTLLENQATVIRLLATLTTERQHEHEH